MAWRRHIRRDDSKQAPPPAPAPPLGATAADGRSDDFFEQVDIWDALGRENAFWAVLSHPSKREVDGWDPDEFFATGVAHVDRLERELRDMGRDLAGQSILDFGCGLGRLSQAMAPRAGMVVGLDASVEMIVRAQRLNRHPDRCAYLLNRAPNLALFPVGSFDLIVSFIVLQHIPPPASFRYLSEFGRVLRPGGLAVLQVPDVPIVADLPAEAFRAEVSIVDAPARVRAGHPVDVIVEVTNTSPAPWTVIPAQRLRVGNHWVHGNSEEPPILDDGRCLLPRLGPGERAQLDLRCSAPTAPGQHDLEVDVVVEGQAWFASRGSQPARRAVQVEQGGPPPMVAAPEGKAPAHFAMFGIPKEKVVELLEQPGLRLLRIDPDHSSGEAWSSWRYLAEKP